MPGPLLNRRSGLSIRNGVLLYKQLIHPMMDHACPLWRSAARSHIIKNQQVLQSKCLRLSTNAPSYVGNRQIHDDLGVPYFSDHIRSLYEIRLEVSRCGEPDICAGLQTFTLIKRGTASPTEAKRELALLQVHCLKFSAIFSCCKANARA